MAILREPITEAQKAPLWAQLVAAVNDLVSGQILHQFPLADLPLLGRSGMVPFFYDAITRPTTDPIWEMIDCPLEQVQIPALHIGGWYDLFSSETLHNFSFLHQQSKQPQKALIGPWTHGSYDGLVGEVDFGLQAYAMLVLPGRSRAVSATTGGQDGRRRVHRQGACHLALRDGDGERAPGSHAPAAEAERFRLAAEVNLPLLREMLRLRAQIARRLGYASWAD